MTSDKLLDRIASLDFEAEVVASTPGALRQLLRRRREVLELRKRYDEGLAPDDLLRQFVNRLLEKGAGAEHFPYQTALAAIAVMLERRFTRFAEEYLTDLARVRSAGFSMASRVARECQQTRAGMSQNEVREYRGAEVRPLRSMLLVYPHWRDRVTEGTGWKFAEVN